MSINSFRLRMLVIFILLIIFPLLFAFLASAFGLIGGLAGVIYFAKYGKPLLMFAVIFKITTIFQNRFFEIGISGLLALVVFVMLLLSMGHLLNFHQYLDGFRYTVFGSPLIFFITLAIAMCIFKFEKVNHQPEKKIKYAWYVVWGSSVAVCFVNIFKYFDSYGFYYSSIGLMIEFLYLPFILSIGFIAWHTRSQNNSATKHSMKSGYSPKFMKRSLDK